MRSTGYAGHSRSLDWPEERVGDDTPFPRWAHPGSNISLDFHGDPATADLVVFSDGNHHMALGECLDAFRKRTPTLTGIFYTTTPPGPMVDLIRAGGLRLGNLLLRVVAHVVISPPQVLDRLVAEGRMRCHRPFAENRGSALLVRRGNPRNIQSVGDLARPEVRLFLSNPEAEAVSHRGYLETLLRIAAANGTASSLSGDAGGPRIVYGERIHHREAPQALFDDCADVAIVYYHLALRYQRLFPELFELVPLGGTPLEPRPHPGNAISRTHAGLLGEGGRFGPALLDYLLSPEAGEIYRAHGLAPAD